MSTCDIKLIINICYLSFKKKMTCCLHNQVLVNY